MWRPPVVTVEPTTDAVATEDAKTRLRIDATDEDADVKAMIAAAQAHVEGVTGTRLITQTVAFRTDDWADLERLPLAPVSSITSIAYVDANGANQTLATSVYEARLYGYEPQIVLKYGQTWPTARVGSLITVTAVVGHGDPDDVPAAVTQAILLLVGDMYAHRETTQVGSVASRIPVVAGVDALLANHSLHLI